MTTPQSIDREALENQARIAGFDVSRSGNLTPKHASFDLEENVVYVWQISLDASVEQQKEWAAVLSFDERNRSERFYFAKDRKQYVVSHGILRELLGRYLRCASSRIEFVVNRFGKPYVKNTRLTFNLSHSGKIALVAVACGAEVGVDVEATRPNIEYLGLAKRFFSRREYREIAMIPVEEQVFAFYRCWTGKEALIKAKGEGLSIPLDSFTLSQSCDRPQVVCLDSKGIGSSNWTLAPIKVCGSYIASLAYEGSGRKIIVSDWNVV